MSSREKPHLNLVIIGHVDHGKSTMTGHLLYLAGAVDERTINRYAADSEKIGRGTWKFAWVLDKLKEERERGVTIDIAFYKFSTRKYYFTIIDAPGHRDFVKNMITGTSQADAAVLVVAAATGDFEAGISSQGQTREHAILAKTLGVNQIIVAINKMDAIDYKEDRYDEIKNELGSYLKGIGYDLSKVEFVPVSGIEGDNLKDKSTNMAWYKGPTLLESLDLLVDPPRPTDKPLRLPIQDVYSISGIGTVPSGRVETGVMKPGDDIIFLPSDKSATVNSIEMHHETVPVAGPGDNIGFNCKGIGKRDVRKGDVVGPQDNPPTVANLFQAQVMVLRHPSAISTGYTPVVHAGTAQVACIFQEILHKTTGGVKEDKPSFIKNGDSAVVRMKPTKPMCVEAFQEFPQLGRFAVRDMGQTIAVGVVLKIEE